MRNEPAVPRAPTERQINRIWLLIFTKKNLDAGRTWCWVNSNKLKFLLTHQNKDKIIFIFFLMEFIFE